MGTKELPWRSVSNSGGPAGAGTLVKGVADCFSVSFCWEEGVHYMDKRTSFLFDMGRRCLGS